MNLGYGCTLFLYLVVTKVTALVCPVSQSPSRLTTTTTTKSRLYVTQDIGRPPTFLDDEDDSEIKVTFLDEDSSPEEEEKKPSGQGRKRWENLNPKLKQRLSEKGQAKAIANKQKREPANVKKRRKYIHGNLHLCAALHFSLVR